MAQNYNVDDILEEIRRKKSGQEYESESSQRTYSNSPMGRDTSPMGRDASTNRSGQFSGEGSETTYNRQSSPPIPRGMPDVRPIGSRGGSVSSARKQPGDRQGRERFPGERSGSERSGVTRPSDGRARLESQRPQSGRVGYSRGAASYQEQLPLEEEPDSIRRERPVRQEEGFRFNAPGVSRRAGGTTSSSRGSGTGGAISPNTDEFSLHFDLDEEEPRKAPPPRSRTGSRRDYDRSDYDAPRYQVAEPEEDLYREDDYGDPPQGSYVPTGASPMDPGFDGSTHELEKPRMRGSRQEPEEPGNMDRSRWQQSYAEQGELEEPVAEDDYTAPEDTPYVEKSLKKVRVGLLVRVGILSVLTFIAIYLALSLRGLPFAELLGLKEGYLLPLPPILDPTNPKTPHPRIFLTACLLLCTGGALVCCNVVGAGFGALFRLRATSDSPAALAILAVLIQGVLLMIYPEKLLLPEISLYFPVALLTLLFTMLGKLLLYGRIWRNFKFLSGEKEKHAMLHIRNRDFAREFSRGLGPDVDRVAYNTRADFVSGFLHKSHTGDYSDNFYCVSAPVSFLMSAALVGGVTAFLSKDAVIAVSAFTAAMCICAPFSSAIVPNLMLGRVSKWLGKRGAMLAGYETAEELADKYAILIDEKELFSGDSVQVHGMKVFAEKRIDEAILDAASVILSCDGLMSGVFLNMIGGNRKMLKKVDGLIYEDGMGVSAWVNGKRVLIGSRELMRTHEVAFPSKDYESRHIQGGRKVFYIANSGELSAMFVVSYNAEPRVAERLGDLERRGMSFVLYTTDPNVTVNLISTAFGIRKGSVRVLPAKLHPEYNFLTRPKEQIVSGGVHAGGLLGMLQLIRASSNVCHSVRIGAVVQLVGIIVGYGLVAFMSFANSLEIASFGMIIVYSFITFVITSLAASIGNR